MPINPNIALGVQPVQQPVNMLGQYAQVMGIKAAQQEMQGNEEMRNLFAGGANFDDPEFQRRGYTANPKAFQELLGKRATTQKTEMEAIGKEIELRRDALVNARTPEDYLKWHDGNSQGKVGAFLKSIGANPSRESIIAQLSQPGGLEKLKTESALGATKLAQELYQTKRTQISAAAPLGQLKLAQEEAARKQKEFELIRGIVSSGTSSATASPVNLGNGGVVSTPQGSPVAGTQTPATGAVARPNVLADQVAPPVATPTPVNGLLNPPAGQTGAAPVMSQKDQLINQISQLARIPSVEASRALDMKVKEHNVLYPDAKIDQDVNGNLISIVNGVSKPVVDRNGLPVKGKPIPETSFEKTVRAAVGEDTVKTVKRAEVAPKNIQKIDETLGILSSGGAITGFGADLRLNVERAMSLYGADIKAGRRVADTQILDALLGSDVFPTLQSMGLGSKNIDTPAEREYLRQVMTGTIKMDRDALLRLTRIRRQVEVDSIKDYNQKIESGKLNNYFKATDQTPEKIEIPNRIIRSGTHKNGRQVNEYADGTIEYAD